MKFTTTPIKELFIVEPKILADNRGNFARMFCKDGFREIGFDQNIAQINHSITKMKGAIRGMHYQRPPYAEIKIVRCIKGRVFDVVVDLRAGSKTFLKWHAIELSAENMNAFYIPRGLAHGFQTLEENCELLYLHSQSYSPEYEGAIYYNDPGIGIQWPLPVSELSNRDRNHPLLPNDFEGIHL